MTTFPSKPIDTMSDTISQLADLHPENALYYTHDDMGLGYLFADYCLDKARYNLEKGCWMVYDGRVWRQDSKELQIAELAKTMTEELLSYASQMPEGDEASRLRGWVLSFRKHKKRETMIQEARSVHPVTQSSFDSDPYLFNMANGTINLKTMCFRPHSALDMLTKITDVVYDPKATCTRFEDFVEEIMCGNDELVHYLQKCIGYGLTGITELECLFILYGKTTRNGKSTLTETLMKVLGDYGDTSDPDVLAAKSFKAGPGGHSEGIARLEGRRFVNMAEPPKNMVFNASLVKLATGSDSINCRFLHQNSFVYKPQAKFFINTNYLPNVDDPTLFTSNRLIVIPFNRHFEPEEQDRTLKNTFSSPENLPGILNWCLEGCKAFFREGLDQPQACKEAFSEYREETDRILQFCNAWLAPDSETHGSVRYTFVYDKYKDWCHSNNYSPESTRNFKAGLEKYFAVKRDQRPPDGGHPTTCVLNCRIRQFENDDPYSVPLKERRDGTDEDLGIIEFSTAGIS